MAPVQSKMSPVIDRKKRGPLLKSSRTLKSSTKNMVESVAAASPASPIIGRRRPIHSAEARLDNRSGRRQMTAPATEIDKENANVKDKTESNPLASPLMEKINIMHVTALCKRSNSQSPSQAKKELGKNGIAEEKENVSVPIVRKSMRVKKVKEATLQKIKNGKTEEKEQPIDNSVASKRGQKKKTITKDLSMPSTSYEGLSNDFNQSDDGNAVSSVSVRHSMRTRMAKPAVEEAASQHKVAKKGRQTDKKGKQGIDVNKVQEKLPEPRRERNQKFFETAEEKTAHQKLINIGRQRRERKAEQTSAQQSSSKLQNEKNQKLLGTGQNQKSVKKKGDDLNASTNRRSSVRIRKSDKASANDPVRRAPKEDHVNPTTKKKIPTEKLVNEGSDISKTESVISNSVKKLDRKSLSNSNEVSLILQNKTPRASRSTKNTKENYKTTPGYSSNESLMNKPKLPIWNKTIKKKTPLERKRRSLRIGSDIFEFTFNPDEEGASTKPKLKKKNKPRQRRIKPKPRTKPTLLTTDLSWQKNIQITSVRMNEGESVREKSNKSSGTRASESVRNVEKGIESVSEWNCDDLFDSCDNEDIFEGFDDETASSFMPPPDTLMESVPMVSASALPTPAISKHISKYIGNSSTPRVENIISMTNDQRTEEPPIEVKDDIAVCFGFDDEESELEESGLNLSPVRKTGHQSQLQITNMTDSFVSDYQPSCQISNMPSRFSWSRLRPGVKNCSSVNYSTSMVAHGRSTSVLSNSNISLVNQQSESKVNKSRNLPKSCKLVNDSTSKSKRQSSRKPKVLKSKGKESQADVNASLLFEEEAAEQHQLTIEEMMIHHPPRKEQLPSSGNDGEGPVLIKSPEKSFSKPPRKSYDRSALEDIRKSFLRKFRGGDTSTETEEEDISPKRAMKRKKVVTKKVVKKNKKAVANKNQSSNDSSLSDISTVEKKNPQVKKKKKKLLNVHESSVEDWASDLNTHFSEIEDFELVCN